MLTRPRDARARIARRSFAILLAASTSIILSGCTPSGDLWAKSESGSIVFAICDGITANSVRVDARVQASSMPDVTVWELRSETAVTFEPGQQITIGDQILGFEEIKQPLAIDTSYYNYYVAVANRGSAAPPSTAVTALFQGEQLSDDHWVDQNGNESENACP